MTLQELFEVLVHWSAEEPGGYGRGAFTLIGNGDTGIESIGRSRKQVTKMKWQCPI